ncbi:hypothetical protein MPTK1_6g09880 [Marchantia polymorpha subsp. ruderalis]
MGQPLEDFPTRWVGNQSLPILQPHDPRTGLQGHDRQFESSTQWIGAVGARLRAQSYWGRSHSEGVGGPATDDPK